VTARLLHWITAAFILLMVPLGVIIASEWGGSWQTFLYDLHRSIGATLIPIIILRLAYRFAHPPLSLPDHIPAIERSVAEMAHWILYTLLILQPLAGWAATSAYPATIVVFGSFELPAILPANRALSQWLFSVHRWIAIVLICIVGAHVAAAFNHHFVRKDRVLMRMITG
jgi:cytochrome b561